MNEEFCKMGLHNDVGTLGRCIDCDRKSPKQPRPDLNKAKYRSDVTHRDVFFRPGDIDGWDEDGNPWG